MPNPQIVYLGWVCDEDGAPLFHSIHTTNAGAENAVVAFLEEHHGARLANYDAWADFYAEQFPLDARSFGVERFEVKHA